ncbi:2-oxoacid:acceptor oxidoreductase family protein [bacterium]
MRKEIVISGFGGQGIMFAGRLLAESALRDGKYVTLFPSYGAEMRGGTANCRVIISDDVIGSPAVYEPDFLLALNKPSFVKFSKIVKQKGIIFFNSNFLSHEKEQDNDIILVHANKLAEQCGSVLAANSVMLGAFVKKTNIVKHESILESISEVLSERKKHLVDINREAFILGLKTNFTEL